MPDGEGIGLGAALAIPLATFGRGGARGDRVPKEIEEGMEGRELERRLMLEVGPDEG